MLTALRKCSGILCSPLDALTGGGMPGNHPLRELQSVARSLIYGEEDLFLRTVAFLLDLWIEDFYFNFAGDILSPASEAVDEIRDKLLTESIGPALSRLSEVISSRTTDVFDPFQEIATSYLNARLAANEKVGGW